MNFEVIMLVNDQIDVAKIKDDRDLVIEFNSCIDEDNNIIKEYIRTKDNVLRVRSIHRITKKGTRNGK